MFTDSLEDEDATSRLDRMLTSAVDADGGETLAAGATLGQQDCRGGAPRPTSVAIAAAPQDRRAATCASEHTASAHRPSQLPRCAQATQPRTAAAPSSLAPQQSTPSASSLPLA